MRACQKVVSRFKFTNTGRYGYSLDQVTVRVPDVDTSNSPIGAGSVDHLLTLENLHTLFLETLDQFLKTGILLYQKAEVCRSWQSCQGLWFEFLSLLVQVDLLSAKLEGVALS